MYIVLRSVHGKLKTPDDKWRALASFQFLGFDRHQTSETDLYSDRVGPALPSSFTWQPKTFRTLSFSQLQIDSRVFFFISFSFWSTRVDLCLSYELVTQTQA